MAQRSCGSLHTFLFPFRMVSVSLSAEVSTLHHGTHKLASIPLVATVRYEETVRPIHTEIQLHHDKHGPERFHIADAVQGSHQPCHIYLVPIHIQEHCQVQGLTQAHALHERWLNQCLKTTIRSSVGGKTLTSVPLPSESHTVNDSVCSAIASSIILSQRC